MPCVKSIALHARSASSDIRLCGSTTILEMTQRQWMWPHVASIEDGDKYRRIFEMILATRLTAPPGRSRRGFRVGMQWRAAVSRAVADASETSGQSLSTHMPRTSLYIDNRIETLAAQCIAFAHLRLPGVGFILLSLAHVLEEAG